MTDHQPLMLIMQQATLSWALDKVGFDLVISSQIHPTIVVPAQKANILVDALSRSKRVKLDVVNNAMVEDNQLEGI